MLYYEIKRDCEIFNRCNGSIEYYFKGELLTKKQMQDLVNSSFGLTPESIAHKINVSPKNTYWSFGCRRVMSDCTITLDTMRDLIDYGSVYRLPYEQLDCLLKYFKPTFIGKSEDFKAYKLDDYSDVVILTGDGELFGDDLPDVLTNRIINDIMVLKRYNKLSVDDLKAMYKELFMVAEALNNN